MSDELDQPLLPHAAPLHRRTRRPIARGVGGAVGVERVTGQRSVHHQHRRPRLRPWTSHPAHHRQRQQTRRHPPRARPHEPSMSTSANDATAQSCSATTANASTVAPPTGGSARSANAPRSEPYTPTCCEPRSSLAALDVGVPLRDVQVAARHADPRTPLIYDRRRENFDRHAAYVVVAFVAGT
jgi:hypothetical protein